MFWVLLFNWKYHFLLDHSRDNLVSIIILLKRGRVIKFAFDFDVSKVKLATIVEGEPKAPFSTATTPRYWVGRYLPLIHIL